MADCRCVGLSRCRNSAALQFLHLALFIFFNGLYRTTQRNHLCQFFGWCSYRAVKRCSSGLQALRHFGNHNPIQAQQKKTQTHMPLLLFFFCFGVVLTYIPSVTNPPHRGSAGNIATAFPFALYCQHTHLSRRAAGRVGWWL